MTGKSWKHRFSALLIMGAVVSLAGWYSGQFAWTVIVSLLLFTTWHVVHVWRLHAWLKNPSIEPPKSLGAWAEVFALTSAMEQRNRKQKKRYRRMIRDFRNVTDAFPDATLIIDKNARLAWFNEAAGSLLKLDSKKDNGRPVKNLLKNPDFHQWLLLGKKKACKLTIPAPGQDNSWLEISSVSIQKGRRLIIMRDISEIHNLDQVRKDFVTNVSHELRTPLTVMRGYLELLKDRPEDDLADPFDRMHTQAVQMQSMLDDLLELSRLQGVSMQDEIEPVDVHAILMQLKEQAEEISRGQHELQFEVDQQVDLVGKRSDLESAFRNLVVNALKYTPKGGRISVSWCGSERGPTLTVADTGIGIPQREIPRLTERFYRVGSDRGRNTGGTGLGLAIVKHVLSAHDAQLEIESDVGVGSKFICRFPPGQIKT
jgi:two-component system phosphate regulon sensor histidine kinase PhoR